MHNMCQQEDFNLYALEDIQCIRELAGLSEAQGSLHPEILELVYRKQWFKLFVPRVYGGPGLLLPEILKLEEALASQDGSLAWTVTLCSGAAWFAGFLDPGLAKEVFANPKVCFAGSGAVGGTAIALDNGFILNGLWHYASGALHATVFTANCRMLDADGQEVLDSTGAPVIKSFILQKEEVEILPGWSYFGLVATGSHAFQVNDILVPSNRIFEINESVQVDQPGFNYPFLQLAETTLAVNSSGMALHFLNLTESAFKARTGLKRYRPEQITFFESELNSCISILGQARKNFYHTFDQSWEELCSLGKISETTLADLSSYSRQLAHQSRQVADRLYPYCGLEAAKRESEINRVWRDLHTASQHSLLTFL